MNKLSDRSSCRPEDLTLLHYGELDAADRLRVEEHLQGCSVCRRELAELRSALEALPKREAEFSPEEIRAFNERVSRRLRPKSRQLLKPAFGWSFAAAAAVLLMVTLRSPTPGPQKSLPEVVEMERLPEPELLLNLELLENLDLLQELEGTGRRG
jgi:anti-sigma factor RsiW